MSAASGRGCGAPECRRVSGRRRYCDMHRRRLAKHGEAVTPDWPARDCAGCGALIPAHPRAGRERLYCNDACRMVAQRRALSGEAARGISELREARTMAQASLDEFRASLARAGLL